MNKKLLLAVFSACMFYTTVHSMQAPLQPIGFGLQIPTSFAITTALDKLSVSNISQTASILAGLSLLHKACNSWSLAATPSAEQPPLEETATSKLAKAQNIVALRYFVTGSIFIATGLFIRYAPRFISKLRTIYSSLRAK
jgi:GTP-dependent phosphoenolpyruvate carboxykinase